MSKNNNLTDFVTDLANTIRAKCKTTGTINPQDFSKFVGGMPFFKFRETVDITANSATEFKLPLDYENTYIKGEVYLTNDNGLTEIGDTGIGFVNVVGDGTNMLLTINNTTDRFTISGYQRQLLVSYVSYFASDDGGDSLINAGWHMKLDIYELCIGDPNGEYTKIDLNNATGIGA